MFKYDRTADVQVNGFISKPSFLRSHSLYCSLLLQAGFAAAAQIAFTVELPASGEPCRLLACTFEAGHKVRTHYVILLVDSSHAP